jgi:fatty acid desaturase
MEAEIYKDKRIRSIQWKDLLSLTTWEIVYELTLSLPWLGLSILCAWIHWYIPALMLSFVFFLTGLRQVHNAYHYALGISERATEWVIFLLSIVMMGSLHAVKYNHLQHHKHCLNDGDIEGMSARMSWWKALLFGPAFPFLLHYNALKNAGRKIKIWILAEVIIIVLVIIIAFYFPQLRILRFHVTAMLIGESMTAFFAVWTVHHDTDENNYYLGRTVRGKLKSVLFYNMFYHAEHHLFPKVPTCHLPELAKRLDEQFPDLKNVKVL